MSGSAELAGYAVDNSRRKVQNVVTDSSAHRKCISWKKEHGL